MKPAEKRVSFYLRGGKMAKTGINWNLYPEDVISNPGKPYVYFLSLSNEILNKVAEYFNQDINEFTDIETGLSSVN